MRFILDFNTENRDDILEKLGAKLIPTGNVKYPPFEEYMIDLESFEDLKVLLENLNKLIARDKFDYSAIVNFDPPCIFFDNKV